MYIKNTTLILIICFLVMCGNKRLYAQGQGNVWYFGHYAGLDFNTTPPTPLLDGQLTTSEGCASIADASGNLLFYTDGIRVWDKTHMQMPNGFGLLGDPSSAQSGVIVPQPGNDSIYYVFTTPDYQSPGLGFRYSIINMNLNGGLGDIVPASKNILLFSPSSEKLASSFHCNNKDIWVVGRSNQDFYSYLITETGISPTPVITSGITNPSRPYPYGMKSSPNGKKIAACYWAANVSELYDFDISTGQLSNPIILPHSSSDYGAEFSPDGTKLYITLISAKQIKQYDLTAPDINASAVVVGTTGSNAGMVQLASDGKIYVSQYASGSVGIIHNPNALGTACNFQPNALSLGGRTGTYGFPTIISNFFAPPVEVLTSDTVCFSSSSNFNLSGVSDADSVRWNFGDPASGLLNTDTGLVANHTYSASGIFNLEAVVYYPCRTDTVYDTIYIAPIPVAAFSAENACGTVPVIFHDSSSVSSGSIIWDWDFGDTANATIANPSHSYSAVGNYAVTLIVTSVDGCKDTVTHTVSANPLPVANLSGNNVCLSTATTFTDLSTANDTVANWNWNFGDTASSALQNPTHIYVTHGTYSVSLTVTNNFGCKDTNITTVIVHPLPSANFSSVPECLHDSTCFSDLSTVSAGAITEWSWHFADALSGADDSSNVQNPCHIYTNSGSFNAVLTVTSDSGCQSTAQHPVVVYYLPVAEFTSTNVCLNTASVFTDSSTLSGGDTITNWNWNFGDTSAASAATSPQHIYNASGNYTTVLVVTTNHGCKDTVSHSVSVYGNPVAGFNFPDSGCTPVCTQFIDLSQPIDGNIAAWDWNFQGGNPLQSDASIPTTVCWNTPGTYDVQLIVSTNHGCKDTLLMPDYIQVYSFPVADFCVTPSQNSVNTPIFEFCSLWSLDVVKWAWNFGDSSLLDTVNMNPVHDYSAAVTNNDFYSKSVCIYVQNQYGCPDTLCKTIDFTPEFSFFMPNTFTPNEDNVNKFFYGKGIGIKEYTISLFDRYGSLIWHCTKQGNNTDWDNYGQDGLPSACKWDGVVQDGKTNQVVKNDVYVWKVRLTDIFDKTHDYIGHVNVVK